MAVLCSIKRISQLFFGDLQNTCPKIDLQNLSNKAIIIIMVSFDEKNKLVLEKANMVEFHLKGRDITAADVLKVMEQVPREDFVPEKYISQAYADMPLPIGMGQTISQPYIVALMTQHLMLSRDCNVLEIGTGSGYQTAILATLSKKVCTIERYCQLSEAAQSTLGRLGIENIEFCIGDGSCGWPNANENQFDRIIITAALEQIPKILIEQLCEQGLIVAPVGGEAVQELIQYRKENEKLVPNKICGCRFVKLIGKYGYPETE